MIRIDEIYTNTFWPWVQRNLPGVRMYYCDPFGHTNPANLFNFGRDEPPEHEFIFFHDQEPVQIDSHRALFEEVTKVTWDMKHSAQGLVVLSERGQQADLLCDIYGWKQVYYFFHGWACLDWYRGYDRSLWIQPPQDRPVPNTLFMCPNRIIGGERQHRVLFVYHILKNNLQLNHISCPLICPEENTSIVDVAIKHADRYPDIVATLSQAALPWLYPGEDSQSMSSFCLDNFSAAMDSMIYVPTETVYFGKRTHITEKTFKAIALGLPFIMVGTAGSLEYLREYGFKTFSSIWDESYDLETDDYHRLEKVVCLLSDLSQCSYKEKRHIWQHSRSIAQHNWDHFYKGAFENLLWQELTAMLQSFPANLAQNKL